MDLDVAIAALGSEIPSPEKGLPEAVFRFASSIVPMINVDLLIRNDEGHSLLTWRSDGTFPPAWHVPGGIIRYKETFHDRIRAVAETELGASVTHGDRPVAITEIIMEPSWRVRGHFISLLYECKLTTVPTVLRAKSGAQPLPGQWDWHDRCPDNLHGGQQFYRPHIGKRSS